MDLKKILLAAGAGTATYFLFFHEEAGATENDTSGKTVDPSSTEGKPTTPPKTLGEQAVAVLLRDLGAHEEPWPNYPHPPSPNSNRGPVVDKINLGVYGDGKKLLGQPWCARTVRYAYEKAAQEIGLPPPFAGIKSTLATASSWKSTFKKWKLDQPKVGAVGLFLAGKKSHAMLISSVTGDTVYTVEGNHNDSVALVKRHASDFDVLLDVEAYVRSKQERVAGYVLGIDVLVSHG